MVLRRQPEPHPVPAGVELRRVATGEDAAAYWRVAEAAYTSIGFPPEVFSYYEDDAGFRADGTAGFLALLDGEPAGIAMTLVSHGIAGIYWVGATGRARGRGLGTAVTAAAVEAGLEMGPEIASLQASPMGESLYLRMGFETIYECRLYASP
jgi:GNAT superfamily N-acetyltransferase